MTQKWEDDLLANEIIYLPRPIKRGVDFIEQSRSEGAGWGILPTFETDLYTSGLAALALGILRAEDSLGILADVSVHFRNIVDPKRNTLGLRDLTGLILIVTAEPHPEQSYLARVRHKVESDLPNLQASGLNIVVLADFYRHLSALGGEYSQWIQRASDYFVSMRDRKDGGWPAVEGGGATPLATAAVTQFLCTFDGDHSELLESARDYLITAIRSSGGWRESPLDIFVKARIAWALSVSTKRLDPFTIEGSRELQRTQNDDGGWGEAEGEISGIETTATVLLALNALGETRFVPARLAEAALVGMSSTLNDKGRALDDLERDLNAKVKARVGKVMAERDKFRRQRNSYQAIISRLEKERDAVFEDLGSERVPTRRILARAFYSIRRRVSKAVLILALVPLGVMVAHAFIDSSFIDSNTWLSLESLAIIWLLAIVIFGVYIRRQGELMNVIPMWQQEFDNPDFISFLEREFLEILEDAPDIIREEMVYRLFSEIRQMPPDVALRFSEDLGMRLGLRTRSSARLRKWIKTFVALDSAEQRLLLERLRRLVL